jgi:mRNA interferase RelE/StbE
MPWRVEYTDRALKHLKKTDRFDARLITSWIGKNLEGRDDPRRHGKGLESNRSGGWRYRVGDCRILCVIADDLLLVEVFSIGHRSKVHKR